MTSGMVRLELRPDGKSPPHHNIFIPLRRYNMLVSLRCNRALRPFEEDIVVLSGILSWYSFKDLVVLVFGSEQKRKHVFIRTAVRRPLCPYP